MSQPNPQHTTGGFQIDGKDGFLANHLANGYHHSITGVLVQDATATAALEAGTVLGRITATGRIAPFDPAATDGSEVAVGILTQTVSMEEFTSAETKIAYYKKAAVVISKLIGYTPQVATDLNGLVDGDVLTY